MDRKSRLFCASYQQLGIVNCAPPVQGVLLTATNLRFTKARFTPSLCHVSNVMQEHDESSKRITSAACWACHVGSKGMTSGQLHRPDPPTAHDSRDSALAVSCDYARSAAKPTVRHKITLLSPLYAVQAEGRQSRQSRVDFERTPHTRNARKSISEQPIEAVIP